ncbi:MAG TPA: histidine phosphatase family protein [Mycobacterium sp.]|nr:histidine phosphatase family protein [Mycobacterium sp.]
MTTPRVYLARHGRTSLNAGGRLRGLSDPPLDDVGLADVARLSRAGGPAPDRSDLQPAAACSGHR